MQSLAITAQVYTNCKWSGSLIDRPAPFSLSASLPPGIDPGAEAVCALANRVMARILPRRRYHQPAPMNASDRHGGRVKAFKASRIHRPPLEEPDAGCSLPLGGFTRLSEGQNPADRTKVVGRGLRAPAIDGQTAERRQQTERVDRNAIDQRSAPRTDGAVADPDMVYIRINFEANRLAMARATVCFHHRWLAPVRSTLKDSLKRGECCGPPARAGRREQPWEKPEEPLRACNEPGLVSGGYGSPAHYLFRAMSRM